MPRRRRHILNFTISVTLLALIVPFFGGADRLSALGLHCPFKWIFHLPCPTCGLTRWYGFISRGEWANALHFQPIHFLLVGWLIFISIRILMVRAKDNDANLPTAYSTPLFALLSLAMIWNIAQGV